MRRARIVGLICGISLLAVGVLGGVFVVAGHKARAASQSVRCTGNRVTHQVAIANDQVLPVHTTGSICDELRITNKDNVERLVAFGPHEHHVAYDGITSRFLAQGQSLSVTLNKTGTFEFHDHLHDEVAGTFTVSR
ncbi:MAG TPA: hypothetical protein VJP80_06805 [Candidatus Saccharimonadales bacterium]|nr:hypothetical protein [Candidatus Saccharimonadales bacterium]